MELNQYSIEILTSIAITFTSFIIAGLIFFILKRYVAKVTNLTKTTVDDEILRIIRKSIPIGIIIVGLYFALMSLSFIAVYSLYLKNAFMIIIVIFAASTIIKIINIVTRWYGEKIALKTETRLDEQFISVFRHSINIFIYFIAFIIIVDYLDIEISPFIATLGIGGIAIAFALQESLSNFFAGFYLSVDRPVRVGDFIKLETGDEGYVEEIGWRSSKIRLLANNLLIVPNSKFAQSTIVNYDRPTKDMGLVIPLSVSYNSDLEKVEKVTIDVAKEVLMRIPGGVKNFEPFIRYNEFGDSNIELSAILRVQSAVDRRSVTHEFIKAIKKRYDEEGIDISYSVREIYIRQ